ncbi:MAG: asparagine synthase [Planctomycetaceae bacterium]|nr:asparagine synthase [Planctomycetaceae bacterium]
MTSRPHPIVHVGVGPSLGEGVTRSRPVGRIGGVSHAGDPAIGSRLSAALGRGSQILSHAGSQLVADHDGCRLDGRVLSSVEDWRAVVNGRLAAVRGAFAVAWHDSDGVVNLARDPIGERTLFYAVTPSELVFASSVQALLATGIVPRTLNLRAVAAYLCYAYLPGRETLVEGVYEVLPGERVTFGSRGLQREQFWELPTPAPSSASEEEQTCQLRSVLETAVRERLPQPDEPVGVTLSGGVDSSLVVALVRRLHTGRVYTYSVSFGPGYANELPFSSLVADHCGTDHRIVELSPAAVLRYIDDSVGQLGDPIGDPLTVPNSLLFRTAGEHVGVVLNGEGGDPCFGGPKNLPMVLWALYPGHAVEQSREASYLRSHLKCYDDLPELLADPVRDAIAARPLVADLTAPLADPRWPDFISRLQAINIRLKGGHHILPKIDALSFPFGVLPRSPLFDQTVVEQSLAIPAGLKLRGTVEKYLLKCAVAELLPQAVLERPKSGMLVPVEGWFRGPLLPAARERVLDGLRPYGLFQRDYLERLLAGKLGGLRPRHGAKIWLLITLESWLRRVLNGR